MPYVSERQRRFFRWAAKHGKHGITPSMASEWEAHTPKDEKLPEKAASFHSFFDELHKIAKFGITAPVRQEHDWTCGSAAVRFILRRLLGVEVPEEEVVRVTGAKAQGGTQFPGFKKMMESFGLHARSERHIHQAELPKLLREGHVVVLDIDGHGDRHLVTAFGIEGDQIQLMEPSPGENFSIHNDWLTNQRWGAGQTRGGWVVERPKTKEAEYAPGIPQRGQISPLPHVKEPEVWQFSAHPHSAERAGFHADMRLGNPKTGIAHSFVVPEGKLPEPGKAIRVMPTYDHTIPYMDFSGEIESGYGKGSVHKGRRTEAEVHHSDPSTGEGTKLRFNLYDGSHPQEFAVRKDKSGWWLHNKTLTRERRPEIPESKPSYKELEVDEVSTSHPHEMVMPKLDGAHTIVHLEAGKIPRVFSYRVGKTSETGLIEHTHKIPGLMKMIVPKELGGTVLRAETIAIDKEGRALPAEQIGGILNSKVWESRKAQEQKGVKLKTFPFSVERFRDKNVSLYPFAEKLKILRKVEEHLPHFQVPELATTPEEKRKLLDDIKSGNHPLTGEGVVVVQPSQVPPIFTKAKHAPDFDVYVREVHPAKKEGGDTHDRAGAVSYSWSPTGPIVGQLGGFKHEEARDMLKNPDKYVGRVAKVRAMRKFEAGSGALFQPRFKEWHLDKGEIDKLSSITERAFRDELQKISSSSALGMAGELAGLGTLAVPSIQHLRGKPMDERKAHMMEVGGLGILAAPYAHSLAQKGVQGFKGLMGLRRLASAV